MRPRPDPRAKIIEGEIYGAPVPGGWPNRGPFQVLAHALGRVFSRRKSAAHSETHRPTAGVDPEGPNAQHQPDE
jgi:hypothetical protein